tara:strand:- start:30 stop:173 length:144 start_codon:yes stop_codon:yes gene_type:complete
LLNAENAIHGDILSCDIKQGKILGHLKVDIDKNFEFDPILSKSDLIA